jgi:hypothetical protein
MYTDLISGATILETEEELYQFLNMTECKECEKEVLEIMTVTHGLPVVSIKFDTTCEHG